jgi:hypothetical protein
VGSALRRHKRIAERPALFALTLFTRERHHSAALTEAIDEVLARPERTGQHWTQGDLLQVPSPVIPSCSATAPALPLPFPYPTEDAQQHTNHRTTACVGRP